MYSTILQFIVQLWNKYLKKFVRHLWQPYLSFFTVHFNGEVYLCRTFSRWNRLFSHSFLWKNYVEVIILCVRKELCKDVVRVESRYSKKNLTMIKMETDKIEDVTSNNTQVNLLFLKLMEILTWSYYKVHRDKLSV